jgi:hypothetical protein
MKLFLHELGGEQSRAGTYIGLHPLYLFMLQYHNAAICVLLSVHLCISQTKMVKCLQLAW